MFALTEHIPFLGLAVLTMVFAGCGQAPPSAGDDGTGAISARLVFPQSVEPPIGPLAAAPLAAPDLSSQVNTIRLVAVPRAGIGSSVSAAFAYTAHQGVLGGVPVGPNWTLQVEGIGGGAVKYRAVRAPILVEENQTTAVGDVPMVKVKSGTCVFIAGQTLATPGLMALAIGPFDEGTTPDLVTVSSTGSNKIWLNSGAGTFSATARNVGGPSFAVVAANLDTVVGAEIVTAHGSSVTFWFNDGAGYFASTGPRFGGDQTLAFASGDVDGDGDLDVVAGNYNADWVLFNGPPTGSFGILESEFAPATDNAIALGDVDGDGDLDLVVADTMRSGVWRNDGSPVFPNSTALFPSSPHGTEGVALGDTDGDGDLDIVLAMNSEPNRLFLNNGSGTFTDSGQDLGTWWTRAVAMGDLDGDGDQDLVFGVNNGPSRVFVNAGNGTFQDSGMELGSADDETLDVALADLDGDGDLDLVQGNNGGTSRVYLNRTTDGPATGKLYFVEGTEIWSWDGVNAVQVTDLANALADTADVLRAYNNPPLVLVGNDLIFDAWHVDYTTTRTLYDNDPWVLDGSSGAVQEIDLRPPMNYAVRDWAVYHDTLWMSAYIGSAYAGSGWGLLTYSSYSSGGDTLNNAPNDDAQMVQDMFVFNDHLYWVVTDSGGDRDLWDHYEYSGEVAIWTPPAKVNNGSGINPSGPFDIHSGNGPAVASSGNRLFMSARTWSVPDYEGGIYNELWVSSNPSYYASLVRNINPTGYPAELHPLSLAFFNGKLHFSANTTASVDSTDIGLWTYDGASAPQEIPIPDGFEVDGKLVPCDGKLFFVGLKKLYPPSIPMTPYDPYRLIWAYDFSGTFDSIQPNPSGDSAPYNLAAFGDKLVFVAQDEVERELWEYDVAADSLRKVQVNPSGGSNPGPMTPWLRLMPD